MQDLVIREMELLQRVFTSYSQGRPRINAVEFWKFCIDAKLLDESLNREKVVRV